MQHLTLNTGHVRWSPREEVSDEGRRIVARQLDAALRPPGSPLVEIPAMPGYQLTATAHDGALVARIVRDYLVILSVLVVPADGAPRGLAERWLWWPATLDVPEPGPWCIVGLHDVLGALVDAGRITRSELEALADYERVLAWTWLERPPEVRRRQTALVAVVPTTDRKGCAGVAWREGFRAGLEDAQEDRVVDVSLIPARWPESLAARWLEGYAAGRLKGREEAT
ncbi:MAG TPA: hypothetical protein VNI83_06040 [Vicinamibacterales bacterium]|nr:hypothetical protein [Vicinamibacterales bacterium]